MSSVQFEKGAVSVDAALIAEGLSIEVAQVQPLMRRGQTTSLCERGLDEDAGRYRSTFFHRERCFRLVADADGKSARFPLGPLGLCQRLAALSLIASLLGASSAALAQGAGSPPGRLLASNCAQCHGTSEQAAGFDKLTGKSAAKLYDKLKDFQSGKEGEGIMARHAMGFTDAQLRALTQWLSSQR